MRSSEGISILTSNLADRVALRGVRLIARLEGMSQRVTVEQTFVNLEERPIEALYTFPLPEGAAVCGFEVITGDRVLTGRINDAEQAIDTYEQAIGDGHGAFMLEQERPDVFTVRVGNLLPRQAAMIRIVYVCALERVDRSIRVAFPTTVAPRYVTDTGTDPLAAAIDGDALNPPRMRQVPYGLTMDVTIDLGREVQGVESPSHTIHVDSGTVDRGLAEAATRVTFAGGITEMNRDIVLSIALAHEAQPAVEAVRGADGETFLAVTFMPEFDVDELTEPAAAGETVFVLDCSGSMSGQSILQATSALKLCLRSLSAGDTFNICRFGSTFELMATEPLPYTQETLDRALAYVHASADLGGTELYQPLEAILRPAPRREHPADPGSDRRTSLERGGRDRSGPATSNPQPDLQFRHRIRLQPASGPRPCPRDRRGGRVHHRGRTHRRQGAPDVRSSRVTSGGRHIDRLGRRPIADARRTAADL